MRRGVSLGFSTSMEMCSVALLRLSGCASSSVAAVAWLAELFPEPKRREKVLGYTQAFSSLGGLMVAFVNGWLVAAAAYLPALNMFDLAIANPHAPWRYTLMSGVLPAIPLILIRPFLPESPAWLQKKRQARSAAEHRRAVRARSRRTTIVTTIMFAARTAPRSARFSRSADRAGTARSAADDPGAAAPARGADQSGSLPT